MKRNRTKPEMMSKWATRIIRTRTPKTTDDSSEDEEENLAMQVGEGEAVAAGSGSNGDAVVAVVAEVVVTDEMEETSGAPEEKEHNNEEVVSPINTVVPDGEDDSSLEKEQPVERPMIHENSEGDISFEDEEKNNTDDATPAMGTEKIEGGNLEASSLQEEDEHAGEEKQSKKRKVKKRLVGSSSTSIKQMKDAVVRTQAMIAASKVATIQAMTTYGTSMQAMNNPKSDTILLNYDEIVERPDKKSEGERSRVVPKWTVLVPVGVNEKVVGIQLEKLGKAMQEEKKRGKKGKAKLLDKKEFDYDVVNSCDKYLKSIYGPDVQGPLLKKAKGGMTMDE